MRWLSTIASLILLTGAASAQTVPGLDCTRTGSEAQQRICRSPALQGMMREIEEAFQQVTELWRDAPDAVAALRTEQQAYRDTIDQLNPEAGAAGSELERFFEQRRGLLRILGEPRDGLAGTWANAWGVVTVIEVGPNRYDVTVEAAEWVSARWVCGISGEADVRDGALTVDGDEGWTLTVRRRGALLEAVERGPEGAMRPYCGASGFVQGLYFPATTP